MNISRSQAYRAGLVDGSGVPAVILIISLIGFGALCREGGLGLGFSVAQLVTMWALPGQIAFIELFTAGNSIFAITLAVAMANARFMPMTATLMTLLRPGTKHTSLLYLFSHFLSFRAWVWVLRRCPQIQPELRFPYYLGFVTVTFIAGIIGILIGYLLVAILPGTISQSLVFVNTLYFVLMLADARGLATVLAVLAGVITGPLIHISTSNWGLLLCGLLGGSFAFIIAKLIQKLDKNSV